MIFLSCFYLVLNIHSILQWLGLRETTFSSLNNILLLFLFATEWNSSTLPFLWKSYCFMNINSWFSSVIIQKQWEIKMLSSKKGRGVAVQKCSIDNLMKRSTKTPKTVTCFTIINTLVLLPCLTLFLLPFLNFIIVQNCFFSWS